MSLRLDPDAAAQLDYLELPMDKADATFATRLLEASLRELRSHAIVLLDAEGTIVGWMAGAERMFGYKAEEIVGQHAAVLFTPEDLEMDLACWEQKTASGSGESEDDRWQVRKDGGKIWVSGTLTALRDEQGRLLGFAKIMRNRTDQKFQVETLESRIAQLQEAEHRKNAFIATLAHELRSPMSALSCAAELLDVTDGAGQAQASAIGTIRRQLDSMNAMINELVKVACTATGKPELRTERVILQDVVRDAVESCRASIDERIQVLQQLFPGPPIALEADPARLRLVLVSLIENATKYTQYGGTIWIKASVEGDDAVIRVRDTGVGIAPEVMPHVFDLFTQADYADQSQGGLGIGLSVVKDNVSLHGGTVQAASDGLGKGAEFTVRLPLLKQRRSGPAAY